MISTRCYFTWRICEAIRIAVCSLAGELRGASHFAKDVTSFSEILSADFFWNHIHHNQAERDFTEALRKAKKIARTQEAPHLEAPYLPGWCGVIEAA